MAIGAGTGGVFETILRARDEASPVVKQFADTTKGSLNGTNESLKTTAQEADKAVSNIRERVATVAKVVGVAALAAGAAGAAMVKSILDQADAISKASRQTGLSTETLGAWQYQASLSGVEAAALTKNFEYLARNLSKAADEKGPAVKALEELGLSAEELKKAGPDKAILAIADALEGVPDKMDRTRYIMDLFGKDASKMSLVLEGGSQAFRDSYKEAEAFGLLINEKTGKAAEQFNDNIDKLKKALGGMAIQVGGPLLGPLAKFSETIVAAVRDTKALKVASDALLLVIKGLAAGFVVIGTLAATAGKIIGGTAAALAALISRDFAGAKSIVEQMGKDIGSINEKSRKLLSDFFKPVAYVPENSPAGFFRKVADTVSRPGTAGVYSDVAQGATVKTAFGTGFSSTQALIGSARGDVTKRVELIEQSLKSEEQLVQESYDRRLATIDAAEALQIQTQTDYGELRKQLEAQREVELTQIHERAARARYQQLQIYNSLSLSSMQFFFSQMGGLMQTKSRALFEIGKAGAIAETIVQTYRAAQGAYAALAGIPFVGPALGAAAAAAAIAVGFARVQAIRATSFGGASGSPVLSSGGTSGPVVSSGAGVAVPAQPYTPASLATPQKVVNLTLQGSAFSANTIRNELIPLLNDALGDGVQLNVSSK
ncbi:MAG: hypothetical protein GC151_13675 [Betaproteobacteria bacterium]|nr:hypothetical protein [Betaproteobacteria bacterium]